MMKVFSSWLWLSIAAGPDIGWAVLRHKLSVVQHFLIEEWA
jgi:hypothetical protein